MPFSEYLKVHNEIDLGLDTFPFNGHTTTVQGLWMGVPTVTLAGGTHRSRMGLSVMRNLGLDEFVAESKEDYVTKVVNWACRRDELDAIRSTMRHRMMRSPLMQVEQFAENFEALVRRTWADRVRRPLAD
jgi:protein O-GlcNAc transferase